MKKVKPFLESKNCSAIQLGALNKLLDYSHLISKLNQEVNGKVFLGEALKATGTEVSFQLLPPHTEMPFFHSHTENEEVYIFLKGYGEFIVDNETIQVKEGSVIRVAPEARRFWKNTSDSPLILIVIQSRKGTLNKFYGEDGSLT